MFARVSGTATAEASKTNNRFIRPCIALMALLIPLTSVVACSAETPVAPQESAARSGGKAPVEARSDPLEGELLPEKALKSRQIGVALEATGPKTLPNAHGSKQTTIEWVFVCEGGAKLTLLLGEREVHSVPCDGLRNFGQFFVDSSTGKIKVVTGSQTRWRAVALKAAS